MIRAQELSFLQQTSVLSNALFKQLYKLTRVRYQCLRPLTIGLGRDLLLISSQLQATTVELRHQAAKQQNGAARRPRASRSIRPSLRAELV